MRPNQGPRRSRRSGNGHHPHSHGGHSGHPHQRSHQPRTAMSLRNQIFDSNGPDTRVRGNAFQVHEKYLALAKDALSSGDRVLAENYLQHAEHYFRIVEAINEATAAEQRQRQVAYEQQPQAQPGMPAGGNGYYSNVGDMAPPSGPQTPLNSLRSPVTMESVAPEEPMQDGSGQEDEAFPPGGNPQTATAGRR